MRKIFKTSMAVALSVCMAAALTACGGSGSSASSEPAAEATEAADAAEETADTGAKIKIGGSGPLTGPAAVYGQAVKNALKDWGMQVSLATVTSAPGAAVSPSYAEDQIFAITPSGSSPAVVFADPDNLSGAYGNVFQMCFTDPNQGSASADYISAHTDLGSKVAIIYKNDDNYSKGIHDTFVAEAAVKNVEVVYEGTFDDSNAQDFSVQLGQAQDAGADIVFLPIYYDPASLILTQANQMGYKPTFFGVDGMDGILTLEGFDTSLAEGVYLLTPFSADAEDELTVNFVNAYKEKCGGEIPNQFAADAYDCVYAIAQACEAAGVTADMSSDEICAKLVEQFTSMTFSGLTGESMTWNENGEVTKSPKAVVIQNGVYVGVED